MAWKSCDNVVKGGIKDALHVQTGTNIILAGHLRQRIALELNLKEVPVVYYDVDDNKARYIMAVDNYQRLDVSNEPLPWDAMHELLKASSRNREEDGE